MRSKPITAAGVTIAFIGASVLVQTPTAQADRAGALAQPTTESAASSAPAAAARVTRTAAAAPMTAAAPTRKKTSAQRKAAAKRLAAKKAAARKAAARKAALRKAAAKRAAAKRLAAKRLAAKKAAARRLAAQRAAASKAAAAKAAAASLAARQAAAAAAAKDRAAQPAPTPTPAPAPKPAPKPAPAPVRPPAVVTSTGDHIVRFAPNNVWTMRADTATALAPDSDAQTANLMRQVQASTGNRGQVNAYEYNTAIEVVAPGTKKIRVGFSDCQHTGFTGEMYSGRKIFENVPVPDDVVPASGSDKQLTIYDPQSDTLWDFWVMERAGDGWQACAGGRIDKVSQNRGHYLNTEGASASGLAIAGGAITIQDIKRGSINHAMNLGVREMAAGAISWPALRTDGGGSAGPGALRAGQRLRLDPSINVSSLGLTPFGAMVARAAQQYGFIVTDSSASVVVVTQSGNTMKARTGVNPWDAVFGGTPWTALYGFPWDKMQALPLDYGK